MRASLTWASKFVRDLFASVNPPRLPRRRFTTLSAERLEDRLALSGAVVFHNINLSVPGDAYTLAGGTEPTDYTAVTKWPQPGGPGTLTTITYSYSNLLDGRIGLDAATVKATIREALSRWAAVAPLRFVEVADSGPAPSQTDYAQGNGPMIRFGHLSIDGAGNVLAYGYYPGGSGLAGDVMFDDGEHWTTNPATGTDLLEVATHEIGHTLGLGHEPLPSAGGNVAIMNAYYQGAYHGLNTSFLYPDDVNGVRAIYGAGTGSVTLSTPTPGGVGPAAAVPSFALNYTPTGGGTHSVVLTLSNGYLVVLDNGTQVASSPVASTASVTLSGAANALNVFTIGVTTPNAPVTVIMAGSQDRVIVGAASSVQGIAGTLTVRGAGGSSQVILDDRADGAAHAVSVTTGAITGLAPAAIQYSGVAGVVVYGTAADTVYLYDGQGGNTFVGTPTNASMAGAGFTSQAVGFGTAVGVAAFGTGDVAYLYDGPGGSTFVSTSTYATMTGAGSTSQAMGFKTVAGVASPGNADVAYLYDGQGSNTFVSTPNLAYMTGAGYLNEAVGFRSAVGVAAFGGNDSAYLFGSTQGDAVFGNATGWAYSYGVGYFNQAYGFQWVAHS